jgi:hypothetical protein
MKSHRIEKAARTARLSAAPPTRTRRLEYFQCESVSVTQP